MKYYLYVLILSDKSAFKVGVTNSHNYILPDRVRNLHKLYSFDLDSSYLVEMKNDKLCRTLEKQLHNDYKEFQHIFEKKIDGYTEFLKYECFEDVMVDIRHKQRLKHLGVVITELNTTKLETEVEKFDEDSLIYQMEKTIREKINSTEEYQYLNNNDFLIYLLSIKESLSYTDNALVIRSENARDIYEKLIYFHDKFNKKNKFKNRFKFFADGIGRQDIAVVSIFMEYDKKSIQNKKIQHIVSFLEKNIQSNPDDYNVFDDMEITRQEIIKNQYKLFLPDIEI